MCQERMIPKRIYSFIFIKFFFYISKQLMYNAQSDKIFKKKWYSPFLFSLFFYYAYFTRKNYEIIKKSHTKRKRNFMN